MPSLQGILDQLNEGRVSTIKQLEDTIKQEKSIAGMLEVRHEVFDILKVSFFFLTFIMERNAHAHCNL